MWNAYNESPVWVRLLRLAGSMTLILLCTATARGQGVSPTLSFESLSGAWSGGWHSQTTGHKGPLNADIRPSSSGSYSATFTGKFFKIIPFRYQMQLNVVSQNGNRLELAGSKKLGPLMGYYSYRAVVQDGQLSASYRTKRDRGTFTLRRR
jgi:hypothetical protein